MSLEQRNKSTVQTILENMGMNLERREKTENTIIASDSPILPNQKIQWFKDRGINTYLPADIELNNAVVGFDFNFKEKRSFDLVIQGDREKFNAIVLFKAEFSPHRNKYSWPCMAYFLKLLYDQSTFVEELSMYSSMCPFDSKLKDILFPGEENRYIRCGSFKLQMTDSDNLYLIVRMSLMWLERNVQADTIEIPTFLEYDEKEVCDTMSNFLLGSSWISASQEVNLGHINILDDFLRALIKKFKTLDAVQSTFPIIVFSGFLGTTFDVKLKKLLSGKAELEDPDDGESGDDRDGIIYTVSKSDAYQMHITFVKPQGTVVFPHRQSKSVRDPPVPIPLRLATKAGRGPRPTYFDIRVTVQTGR